MADEAGLDHGETGAPDDDVVLSLPAGAESLRIARLVATAQAARIGYDVDGVDKVRSATSELCGVLVDHQAKRVEMRASVDGSGALILSGGSLGVTSSFVEVDALSEALLDAATESWRIVPHGEGMRFEAVFAPPARA